MLVEPKVRGFICTTAHPVGCTQRVKEQIAFVRQRPMLSRAPQKVLIIGASTGYGLASRIVAAFGAAAKTIGVFFERPSDSKRTASAGWYNSAAFEHEAHQAGLYAKSVNGDAFSDVVKQQVIELIQRDWEGKVDCVIYSLASPRRVHPKTGIVYQSVLKPIGQAYANKTLDVMAGTVGSVTLQPASEDDITATTAVMGGEDWQYWIEALMAAGVVGDDFMTIAYSYLGPELTYPIYRQGTIGKAKEHLERTARMLDHQLQATCGGHAYVSINKGLVTQASSAIPIVPLYFSLLFKVMKKQGTHEGCIEQIWRLFADRLCVSGSVPVDTEHRIRIDELEMREVVQQEVATLWEQVTTDNIAQLADLDGYRQDFYQLFGFAVSGVDYRLFVDPLMQIPSIVYGEKVV